MDDYDEICSVDTEMEFENDIYYTYKYLMDMVNNVDSELYNPDFFAYLTYNKFRRWVLNQNKLNY